MRIIKHERLSSAIGDDIMAQTIRTAPDWTARVVPHSHRPVRNASKKIEGREAYL
jgi:hypothetical protein